MFGMLSDRCNVTNIILLSTLRSAIAVFIFWGLAGQVSLLVMFALLYGFFAGGFSVTWPGVMKQLKREKPAVETGRIFGMLAGARGIGNGVSGPFSSVLVNAASPRDARLGYDTQYEWLVVLNVVTALFGGCVWGWKTCGTFL